ncbi:MAG: Sugar transporter SemiSWEET [Candidatus Saccharibacteria bacterium]|nr:Sugar transporter SemiSWEET [Candidatus Saccharibacteria bacterium]
MPSKSHHRLKWIKQKSKPLEQAMLIVAIFEPLMTIPQIIDIYSHPGEGYISVLTWVLYAVASLMWLVYGLYNHNKPLILTGILWLIMEVLVIAGILWP